MGGDFAPRNVLLGAVEALEMASNRFEVTLVGPEEKLRDELKQISTGQARFTFAEATQVIDMHDAATAGVKQKRDSSISIGMTLHKDGKVDAFVSAGHSGAVMSTATLILGRIEGISRPTIGTFFPTVKGVCLLLDAGANVDCKPHHLYEFALMGSIYTKEMFGIEKPKIALLNIGEEETKGNEAVKEANKLLKQSQLNFIGNVEGRDILSGEADVIVCDGFVGNVILKFGESIPTFFKHQIKKVIQENILFKLSGLVLRSTLRKAFKSMDYEEFGGVPVLGVNGVTIIGHGKSTPKAIRNMIFRAEEIARKRINNRIQEAIKQ
ncbi:MAG: phosphate acyltransferase PlsX [Ignavibacteriales bacterium]|nr:phosphate acyltransferase PlsX [Ignavibacteriales bacterium]